jgi:hypothetical protein
VTSAPGLWNIANALTVVTGVDYVLQAMRLRRTEPNGSEA